MSADPRRRLGSAGEDHACAHLERSGLVVLERNFRTRWGELDVVACSPEVLVFCEVKTRRLGSGHPWDALGPVKQRRVRRMAAEWLQARDARPHPARLRFDAVGVVLDARGRLVRLDHLEDAF